MRTRFASVRDLHALYIGDVIEVSEGRRAAWRPARVSDRQSPGAPPHIPFHLDIEFNDDEGGPYEIITISTKELHPNGQFRIRRQSRARRTA